MKQIYRKIATLALIFTMFFSMAAPITCYAASGDTTVYVTATGSKYHNAGCRYLKRSCFSISLQDAVDQGYTACSVCNPPALTASKTTTATVSAASDKTTAPAKTTSSAKTTTAASSIPSWFDAAFYATTYPDVVLGLKSSDAQVLYNHYIQYGITEGRFPNATAMANAIAALKAKK